MSLNPQANTPAEDWATSTLDALSHQREGERLGHPNATVETTSTTAQPRRSSSGRPSTYTTTKKETVTTTTMTSDPPEPVFEEQFVTSTIPRESFSEQAPLQGSRGTSVSKSR